jgi:hypothetical protein
MLKNMIRIISLLLVLVACLPVSSFGMGLNVDGEVRLRYEMFDNFNDKYYGANPSKGEAEDVFLLSRIRLGLDYTATDTLSARLCIQDARAFGWGFSHEDWYSREFGMEDNPQEDYLELSDAYIIKSFERIPLTMIAGRQRIMYGDGRAFGPGEWKNSGRWIWDAVKFSWKRDKDYLDLFYGKTVLHDHDDFSLTHRHGYEGAGLYGHIGYGTFSFEPMAVMKANRHGNELYERSKTYYGGLRFYDTDVGNLFYDAMFIKSFGTKRLTSGKEVDISAYGYHVEAGYNFRSITWKPRFGMAYSFAKGDNPATEKDERFDGVFGASDRYYGRMNLMQWSNMKDMEAFIILKPSETLQIKGEYHRFLADEKGDKWLSYKIASMTEDHYGDEFDVVTSYTLNKSWGFQAGVGCFMPGRYIREASTKTPDITDNTAWSAFLQITYSFDIDLDTSEKP